MVTNFAGHEDFGLKIKQKKLFAPEDLLKALSKSSRSY